MQTQAEGWSPREFIIATEARIPVILGSVFTFKLGVQKLAELLWGPAELKQALGRLRHGEGSSAGTHESDDEDSEQGDAPTATHDQVVMLLKAAPRRVEALLDSAARTGAEMVLQTVRS